MFYQMAIYGGPISDSKISVVMNMISFIMIVAVLIYKFAIKINNDNYAMLATTFGGESVSVVFSMYKILSNSEPPPKLAFISFVTSWYCDSLQYQYLISAIP